ncbi:MAG: RluA family pseudouridine synthase [Sphaerochaetaceae bacterium]|nr:RluA family pseudouridine synthase [Sphaerochaetaceae bacterium]
MIRSKSVTFISDFSGRVDKSNELARPIFSREDTIITINGKIAKKSSKVKVGDLVKVDYTEEFFEKLTPQNIPLAVLYEDDDMLVINKSAGMVVHPGAGNYENTLVNALLYRYGEDFQTLEDEEENLLRPGIVHRLDKDTSGVLVVAKTAQSHSNLSSQFALHSNEKIYIAICKGVFVKKRGKIDNYLKRSDVNRKQYAVSKKEGDGKRAITNYQVLRQFENTALVRLRIETGRTHQIRVHMASLGHPVLGDELYGRKDKDYEGLMCLHSFSLKLDHPVNGKRLCFRAPMPERIKKYIESKLRNQ